MTFLENPTFAVIPEGLNAKLKSSKAMLNTKTTIYNQLLIKSFSLTYSFETIWEQSLEQDNDDDYILVLY